MPAIDAYHSRVSNVLGLRRVFAVVPEPNSPLTFNQTITWIRVWYNIKKQGGAVASFGVGLVLRQERLRQDLSLSDIAGQTRISERYLEAIEQENFETLPGVVFTRNFVRQYASALKVDPEPILAELPKVDLATTPLPDPPARVKRSKWDPRWTSSIASLTWSGLAIGAAFAAYLHFNRPAWSLRFLSPSALIQSVSAATPVREVSPAGENAAQSVQEGSRPGSAHAGPVSAATRAPAAEKSTTPAARRDNAARPIQVVLTAHAPAWVQVVADGKTAFIGTLQPNDSRSIAADALVKLVTGNAGGIGISLNGKTLEPLGPSGQIRTVKLTAEGLQFVQKTPPPVPDPL
jgi:cytoskeletal protein RodZ